MEKLREKSFMDAAVELKDVVKTFVGGITAVDHISLSLRKELYMDWSAQMGLENQL